MEGVGGEFTTRGRTGICYLDRHSEDNWGERVERLLEYEWVISSLHVGWLKVVQSVGRRLNTSQRGLAPRSTEQIDIVTDELSRVRTSGRNLEYTDRRWITLLTFSLPGMPICLGTHPRENYILWANLQLTGYRITLRTISSLNLEHIL